LRSVFKVIHGCYYGNEVVIISEGESNSLSIKFYSYNEKFKFLQYLADAFHYTNKNRLRIWVNYLTLILLECK
jgi:hypothetical protein